MEKVTSKNGVYTAQMKDGVITESHCEMAGIIMRFLSALKIQMQSVKGIMENSSH